MNENELEKMIEKYSDELLEVSKKAIPISEEKISEDTGSLKVNVTTGRGMFPVENALIKVYKFNESGEYEEVNSVYTDNSGITEEIGLPANSCGLNDEFISTKGYKVTVEHPGFKEYIFPELEVFGGVVSVLPVDLLPEINEVI